jgi:ABC-type multidrug transport system ATPase subunit
VISVQRLTRRFGEREVVHDVDLVVGKGERKVLHGPNGSGKTTVLRCVLGTVAPTSGRVEVGGHAAGSLEARKLIGATLSQERSFYLRLTGRRNLLFFARVRGLSRREAEREVAAVVDELELEEIAAQRCDRCSSGMLQQLALARALLTNPPVLLLDEPTRSLDTEARARLWSALDRRTRTAVLLATHLDEDLSHVDHVLELQG